MQRLIKAARRMTYAEFERDVLQNPRWFRVPAAWTKAHLQWFWIQYQQGGRS